MTARTRWSVAALAVAALALGACSNNDADRDDVFDTLKSAGASEAQASCVADRLGRLDQEQLNKVAKADDLTDLDQNLEDTVNTALTECLTEGAATEDTTDTTAEGEGTDTTATTAG